MNLASYLAESLQIVDFALLSHKSIAAHDWCTVVDSDRHSEYVADHLIPGVALERLGMSCHNCGKPSLFQRADQAGQVFSLCLDCEIAMHNMLMQRQRQNVAMINYTSRYMESVVGMPIGHLGRIEIEAPTVIQPGAVNMNNIRIENSAIGVLNTGTINSIDGAITVLRDRGNAPLADAVASFTEAVANSRELADSARRELIEILETVAKEGLTPKEHRKPSMLRTLLARAQDLLSGAGGLVSLWDKVKPLFEALLS